MDQISVVVDREWAEPQLTTHAEARSRQRRIGQVEVNYVLEHAQLLHRTGIRFYFLRECDIPSDERHLPWVQRLIGTTLLVSPADEIITVYKNPKALSVIRKKPKYRRHVA